MVEPKATPYISTLPGDLHKAHAVTSVLASGEYNLNLFEAQMKLKIPLLTSACLLTAISAFSADTVPPTGHDNRIEWQVVSQWPLETTPVDIVHSLDGKLVFILDNQHKILVYDNQGNLQGRIPVGEGVTRIDIAPRGEALYLIDDKANSFTSLAMNYTYNIDITGSPFKGNADAPVTVAVFTDFE